MKKRRKADITTRKRSETKGGVVSVEGNLLVNAGMLTQKMEPTRLVPLLSRSRVYIHVLIRQNR